MVQTFVLRTSLCFSLVLFSSLRLLATDYFVDVYANGYSPSYLQIAPGDSVYWVNQDDFEHSITSDNNLWPPGYLYGYLDEFGLTFNSAGTYPYYSVFDTFTGTIVVSSAPPPPANDQCTSAVTMNSGTVYNVNTAGATATGDPTPTCASVSKGVWYTFTPAASGLVTISTCGSDFDTVVAVYTGSCGALSTVAGACNDDNGPACTGSAASVSFSGTAGTMYRIFVGGYGTASGNLQITATNSASANWQEATLTFNTGASIARSDTNLIHLVDTTNDRLLTFDTESGAFISSIRLEGKLASSGLMCISLDGQLLYVPLTTTNKLQVISLATLTTQDLVPLTNSPASLATGSDGALYAIANGQLTKFNPLTGQNLGVTINYYYSPMIKANASGTRLYIMDLGLSGGGSMIDEYAVVPAGLPTYVTNHFNGKSNDKDFVIAEDIGWLYSTSGGVYGVGAWNMATRTYYFWPYNAAYGVAVAMIPNDSYVYGSSGDPYTPRIRRFDRLTGAVSATYDINASGRGNGSVYDRSIKVTPNGRIYYARETRKIGLIGGSTLNTNIPTTAEIIDAGTNRTVTTGESFTLNATALGGSGGDSFTWAKLAGPGLVTLSASNSLSTQVQITTPGNYTLEIVRSNATWQSRDRLFVTVVVPPFRLDQLSLNAASGFHMRLIGGPGTFEIQASSNLVNWDVISNVVSASGEVFISDPSTNRARRYYRARSVNP